MSTVVWIAIFAAALVFGGYMFWRASDDLDGEEES